jgi:hypothetical protein
MDRGTKGEALKGSRRERYQQHKEQKNGQKYRGENKEVTMMRRDGEKEGL